MLSLEKILITFVATFTVLATACGGSTGNQPKLVIEPADATIDVINGSSDTVSFTATLLDGGDAIDVTDAVTWDVANNVGTMIDATFTASGNAAGPRLVLASYGMETGSATVNIHVETTRLANNAPANSADLFAVATTGQGTVDIVYPLADTLLPANLGNFEVHWQDGSTSDLAELQVESEYTSVKVYTAINAGNAEHWEQLLHEEWRPVSSSAKGQTLTLSVRTLDSNNPSELHEGALALRLAEEEVLGGIYYWDSQAVSGGLAGVMRHDMAKPEEQAELFYPDGVNETRCVGCHALSRDGTKMVARYDGDVNNLGNVVTVGDLGKLYDPELYQWTYAAFHRDNRHVVTADSGGLRLLDSNDGSRYDLHLGSYTQPDVSPAADKMAYTTYGSGNALNSLEGSITIADLDLTNKTILSETVLVTGSTANNNFYPSISPDGQWVLFNREESPGTAGDSNDNPNAELWVIKIDGSIGPLKLATPNRSAGHYNSWPKWAPFTQTEDGETVFWFTFSSRRQVGIKNQSQLPQLWMAPFFPDRAAANQDASAPAFWLPFQVITHGNHIAQWTEAVVAVN